jgi:hypothetical protein
MLNQGEHYRVQSHCKQSKNYISPYMRVKVLTLVFFVARFSNLRLSITIVALD